MTSYLYERVREGRSMPDVYEIRRDLPIGSLHDDILLLVEYSIEDKREGQV